LSGRTEPRHSVAARQNCLIEDGGDATVLRSVLDCLAGWLANCLPPAGWLSIDRLPAG
jgi:hypothetical protein